MVLAVGSALILTALYLLFADQILAMFGGTVNAETFRYSQEYFFYISLGIPFYMFGQTMNPVIRADGAPRFAMISTLAGAVVNILLDPIFLFVCRWGMMGAAVATVIGQVITAGLAVWYLPRMKVIRPGRRDLPLHGKLCSRMLTLGITSFLSQISLVAAMAAINNMLRKYGALDPVFGQAQYAQIPMAVVGIVMKFFQIVISIVVGMTAESTALSMVREVVFGVGFALLLPRFFGLDGVLYSMPLSDILTFLIAGYLIYKTYHELNYHIALDSGDRH